MNFEQSVQQITCSFPCFGLHHFLFDERWFDAESFIVACGRRLTWVNYARNRTTLLNAVQAIGGMTEPVAIDSAKLAPIWQEISKVCDKILDAEGNAVSPADAAGQFIENNDIYPKHLPLLVLSNLVANIEKFPEIAVSILSGDGRITAAAVIYVQACFSLAGGIISYCDDRAREIPFSSILKKIETARKLSADLDKSGQMILADFRSRVSLLREQFKQVRPGITMPPLSVNGALKAAGVGAVALAVFIVLVSPPKPSAHSKKNVTNLPSIPLPADQEKKEFHGTKKAVAEEDLAENRPDFAEKILPEQPEQNFAYNPRPRAHEQTPVPADHLHETTEPAAAQDNNSSSASGSDEPHEVHHSPARMDRSMESTSPELPQTLLARKQITAPQTEDRKPSVTAQRKQPYPTVSVTTLMDNQDRRLLNKHLETDRPFLYYSWFNRASNTDFEITFGSTFGYHGYQSCREVSLWARKHNSTYHQRMTLCNNQPYPDQR